MTDLDRLQIEMAASGRISGTLEEWPNLVVALKECGHRPDLDTPAIVIKVLCRSILGLCPMMQMGCFDKLRKGVEVRP